jgi:uncharacterized membrane protein
MTNVDTAPREAAGPARVRHPRPWLWAIAVAAPIGMAATITQVVERIALAEDPQASFLCDINGTFACGNVLTAWQSSVFGPIPNSVIGLTVFTIMLTTAAGTLLGARLSRPAWGVATFLAAFMAAFVVWFLAQTTFSIQRVCLYCLVIGAMVLVINMSVWRVGYGLGFLDDGNRLLTTAGWLVRGGTDVVVWLGIGVVVAAMMVAGFQLT